MGLRAVSNASDYLGAFAWVSLPAAASYAGYRARVTDYGVNLMVISDGVRWAPAGKQLLGRGAAGYSVTGTASETALATVTAPGNLLGLNGGVEIRSAWSYTNNADTKSLRVRFGGAAGTVYGLGATTASGALADLRAVRNRGSAASQVSSTIQQMGASYTTGSGSALITSSTDTTINQDIVLSGQLAVTTDQITLENYEVWVSA